MNTPPSNAARAAERRVACPACGGPSLFEASNRWRPFCSARCAGVDLGAWANENYRVAAPPLADSGEPEADAAGPRH